jgi:hypothetical protein
LGFIWIDIHVNVLSSLRLGVRAPE